MVSCCCRSGAAKASTHGSKQQWLTLHDMTCPQNARCPTGTAASTDTQTSRAGQAVVVPAGQRLSPHPGPAKPGSQKQLPPWQKPGWSQSALLTHSVPCTLQSGPEPPSQVTCPTPCVGQSCPPSAPHRRLALAGLHPSFPCGLTAKARDAGGARCGRAGGLIARWCNSAVGQGAGAAAGGSKSARLAGRAGQAGAILQPGCQERAGGHGQPQRQISGFPDAVLTWAQLAPALQPSVPGHGSAQFVPVRPGTQRAHVRAFRLF